MPRSSHSSDFTSKKKADQYEALNPLVRAMHSEFQELSKKKPDGALNKGKVQIANRLLKDILAILEGEPSSGYLDLLDEETLPQNSDVSLMLSQYCAALDTFHGKYHGYNFLSGAHTWHTK